MSLQPLGVNTGSIAHRPLGKRFLREQWRLGHFAKPLGYRTPVAQALPPLGQHSPLLFPETGFSGWEMEAFWQVDRPLLRETASRSSAEKRQLPAAPEQRPPSRLQHKPEAKFSDNLTGASIASTPDVSHAANQPSSTLPASVTPQPQRENVSASSHISLKPLGHHAPLVQLRSLLTSTSHSDPEATALGKPRSKTAAPSQLASVTETSKSSSDPETPEHTSVITDSLQRKEDAIAVDNHILEERYEVTNHQFVQRKSSQLKQDFNSVTNSDSNSSPGKDFTSSTSESSSSSPSPLIQPRLESSSDTPASSKQASVIPQAESLHTPSNSPPLTPPAPPPGSTPHQTSEVSTAPDAASHQPIVQRKGISSTSLTVPTEKQAQILQQSQKPGFLAMARPETSDFSLRNPVSQDVLGIMQNLRQAQSKSRLQRSSISAISDTPDAPLSAPSIQLQQSQKPGFLAMARPETSDFSLRNPVSQSVYSVASARSSTNENHLTSHSADSTAPESPTTPAKTTIQAKSIPSGDQQNPSIPEIASPAALNPLGSSKPLSPTLNQSLNQSLFLKPINVHTVPNAETGDQGSELNGRKPSVETFSSVKAIPDSWSSLTELIREQSSSAISHDRPATESASHSLISRYPQSDESLSIAAKASLESSLQRATSSSSERSISLQSPVGKTDYQLTPADERSFELLAQQVYRSVRQRMGTEQEYQQNYSVCYPEWFNFVLLNSLSNTVSSNKPSHSTGSSSTPKQSNDQPDGAIISRKLQQLVDETYILLQWRSAVERERCGYGYLNSRYSLN